MFETFIGHLARELEENPRPLRLIYDNALMHRNVVEAGFEYVGRLGRVSVYSW